MSSSSSAIAVACDRDGTIRKVLHYTLGLVRPPVVGENLAAILAPGNADKLVGLLTHASAEGSSFDWMIDVEASGGVVTLRFGAFAENDGLLVIAAETKDDIAQMVEQFLSMNNELVNTVRDLRRREARVNFDIDEFTSVNNQLVNLQRELTQKNVALAKSQYLLHTILDTTPSIVYLFDLDAGRLTYINRGLENLVGFNPVRTVSESPDSITVLFDPVRERDWIERIRLADEGEVLEREYKIQNVSGQWRWFAGNETVFSRHPDGSPFEVLGSAQDVTKAHDLQEELRDMALIDPLTGLHNRRGFDLLASQAIAQASRANQDVGVIYADVDRFKSINDQFGHAEGDLALQEAARILRATVRPADVLARQGGDEFIVLAVGADIDGLNRLGERLEENLAALVESNKQSSKHEYAIRMSWGVALERESAETSSLEKLIALADSRMYEKKVHRHDEAE